MARYLYGGRTEQAKAAIRRESDAKVLREEQHWRGAMYLLGYVVECKLKCCLMDKYRAFSLEQLERKVAERFGDGIRSIEVKTHKIVALFDLLGKDLLGRMDPETRRAYHRCSRWRTDWRYDPDQGNETECASFFEDAKRFLTFISRNS
jgi:hypothetical protein